MRLAARSYKIRIGTTAAVLVGAMVARYGDRCVWLTESNVARRVLPSLARQLRARGLNLPVPWVLPAGEAAKQIGVWRRLQTGFLRSGVERGNVVVALGGGSLTDLAGFAAATYMRGVDWIAIPTTLLGMVDAAIGGKVGVNLGRRKNIVGAFHQPREVLAATDLLQTLPHAERRNGLAEVVKYAMIADRRLFESMERHPDSIGRPDGPADAALVGRCCRIKSRVVADDEREAGARAALNFGHTVAHALEANDRHLRHGEAVGLGMLVACQLAEDLGIAREPLVPRLSALLGALGLPRCAPRQLSAARLLGAMRSDKKTVRGRARFVLTPQIGRVLVGQPVDDAAIRSALGLILRRRRP